MTLIVNSALFGILVFFSAIISPTIFRVLDQNRLEKLELTEALETSGLGTGAAVADLNGDGILELLVANGESAPQPLSLFSASIDDNFRYLRVDP